MTQGTTLNAAPKAKFRTETIEKITRFEKLYSRSVLAEKIKCQVLACQFLTEPKYVLCFGARRGEVPTDALIKFYLRQGAQVFLPHWSGSPENLTFLPVDGMDIETFMVSKKSFWRVEKEKKMPLDLSHLIPHSSICFIPGIAFDPSGWRLGRGGGFYDHFLKTLPNGVLKVGLAYDLQRIAYFPKDTWDARVDVLITEKGMYEF